MRLTVQVKLLADASQGAILKATLKKANASCDWLSELAWKSKEFSQLGLHKIGYMPARKQFPDLSSQVIVRAIAKTVDAYKLDCKVCRRFKPLGSFPYDARILSWRLDKSTVSIWALGGRLKIPFVCGPRQLEMLQHERGEADLVLRGGVFYLFVSVTLPETLAPACKEWLGIDLGLVNLAQSSDGHTFGNARKVAGLRNRRWRQRKRLQSRCTRSAKRVLRGLRGREGRFVRHENHVISKQIVAVAKRTGRGVAMEDLRNIRSRIRASKKQHRVLHSWAFADLLAKIEYKCKLNGVPVKFVDPRNTSRTCPACGNVSKKNRPTRDKFACQSCGFTADADTNAAVNIRGRASIIRPNERWGARDHVQNPPFMVG
jgi:IS605 OrfB family transposase